jgi:hypothetical protein
VISGTVAEWTNAPALKADEPKGSAGSNPARSAKENANAASRLQLTRRIGLFHLFIGPGENVRPVNVIVVIR